MGWEMIMNKEFLCLFCVTVLPAIVVWVIDTTNKLLTGTQRGFRQAHSTNWGEMRLRSKAPVVDQAMYISASEYDE